MKRMKYILKWWKNNAARFPILARMARDVLAVPVSTVVSETAFSTSGRILNEFRTSLTPFMVQALVCAQDWLRGSITINIEEDEEELLRLEKGNMCLFSIFRTSYAYYMCISFFFKTN